MAKLVAVWLLFTVSIVLPFRWVPPPTTAFMVWNALDGDVPPITYRWVPLERISAELPLCVVAAEDQKFPTHNGFDLESIRKALDEDGRRRGASTISQQVAKNLYLWSGRSYVRKGLEAYLTVWIELLWSKRRILEVYVNVAEFGPGVFGAEAASTRYFNRSAEHMTRAQAALLAAVLPNPKKLSASRPSAYLRQRQSQIMRQARSLGGTAYLRGLD